METLHLTEEELAPESRVTLPKSVTLEKITLIGSTMPTYVVRWHNGVDNDFRHFMGIQLNEAKAFARNIRDGGPHSFVQLIDF